MSFNYKKYRREERLRLRMMGLTRRGTPITRRIFPKHVFCGCRTTGERQVVRQRIRRQESIAAGLTWDGQPRKNRRKIITTSWDRAWQTFRAAM